MVKEFLAMKKETAKMMSKPEKIGTLKNIHYQDFDFPQKTEEECSLINARIRQKLNHKKMISMYRYGWLICFFFSNSKDIIIIRI